MKDNVIGKWAFIIGLVIALIASFWVTYLNVILPILFLLGLIVGFLNISEKNKVKFLVATIALLAAAASLSFISFLGMISQYITAIVNNFIAFVLAAALVVSIKAIVETNQK